MREIALSSVDLNLLVVFEAILDERSVSRAADRLNLTQSAVSHSLARLRTLMGDPLFIRSPRGMQPTSSAEAIAGRVGDVLRDIRKIFAADELFDPAGTDQRFTIGMTDYLAQVVLPALVRRVSAAAPQARVVVIPTNARACTMQLERGDIDIYVGTYPADPPGYLVSSDLFVEETVAVARAGHPAFQRRLTQRALLAYPHLHVSPSGEPGLVDQMLARQKLTRRVALTVGNFLVAPAILEQGDLIALLPRRIAEPMAQRYALAVQKSPIDMGESRIGQTWHRRFDNDPGLTWLRQEIVQAGRDEERIAAD